MLLFCFSLQYLHFAVSYDTKFFAYISMSYYKSQQNMPKNLFTKLCYTPSFNRSEEIAVMLTECIVSRAIELAATKEMRQKQIDMLHKESMNKQTFTVEQAFARNPFRTILNQDSNALSFVKESGRPLSAKIDTIKRELHKPTNTRRSVFRYSRTSTVKSSKSIAQGVTHERRKGRFEKVSNEKFILLADENDYSSFEEQQYITMLREKKLKEQAYERGKKSFFKTMAEDQEKNDKINKKFIQQIGSKNFYYNKNGELVETSNQHIPSKLLKKTITSKTENSKRQPNGQHLRTDTVLVQYKEKENPYKKVIQTVFISTSTKNLFYKSENCKYKVLD